MRNAYHIFIGATLMYLIGCLTNFQTYTLDSKIIGVPLVSITIGLCIGFIWEWFQSYKLMTFFDWNDVFRTAIGTFIGGLFSLFIVSDVIMIITCVVSCILVVNDLTYILKK